MKQCVCVEKGKTVCGIVGVLVEKGKTLWGWGNLRFVGRVA